MSTIVHFLCFSPELSEGISLVVWNLNLQFEFTVLLFFAPSDLGNPKQQDVWNLNL